MTDTLNLQKLETTELFWLWRMRQTPYMSLQRSKVGYGISQEEAGERLGIGRNAYQNIELGRVPACFEPDHAKLEIDPDNPALSRYECCLLARRRSGLELYDFAAALGVSHVWLIWSERRGKKSVVSYWEKHGFHGFPAEEVANGR
jgi:hypothetical protein